MATGTLTSVEEYLDTSYRPDCEYVDGVVLERNVGEMDHSSLLTSLGCYLCLRQKKWGTITLMTVRVQVKVTQIRVPDLCVILRPVPSDPVVQKPPFICIEVLARQDTVESMQDRIDDYLAMGVPYVWLLNPRRRRAFVYTSGGIHEVKDGILRTENPEIVVPLAEVFSEIE